MADFAKRPEVTVDTMVRSSCRSERSRIRIPSLCTHDPTVTYEGVRVHGHFVDSDECYMVHWPTQGNKYGFCGSLVSKSRCCHSGVSSHAERELSSCIHASSTMLLLMTLF